MTSSWIIHQPKATKGLLTAVQARKKERTKVNAISPGSAWSRPGANQALKSETLSNSETSKAKERNHKYDSLKFYREGPNPESGELDPNAGSEDVQRHNQSVAKRHDKA
jgi:hypothetical protein